MMKERCLKVWVERRESSFGREKKVEEKNVKKEERGRTRTRTSSSGGCKQTKRSRAGPQGTLQAVVFPRRQNREVTQKHKPTYIHTLIQ